MLVDWHLKLHTFSLIFYILQIYFTDFPLASILLINKTTCQYSDMPLAYSRMSGMMTNAIGGPAAGVGGLTDLSSLIQA